MENFYKLLDQIEEAERTQGLGMADNLRAEAEKALEKANKEASAPNLDHPIIGYISELMG